MRIDRPHMPGYGIEQSEQGLLPWEWARERLERAHNYWLATSAPDGTPHLAAVWGVWHGDSFYFSSGRLSRKVANLRHRPLCSVAAEGGAESIVVRGHATVSGRPGPVSKAYRAKYGMGFPDPLWKVRPQTVIAVVEAEFATAATRWTFAD